MVIAWRKLFNLCVIIWATAASIKRFSSAFWQVFVVDAAAAGGGHGNGVFFVAIFLCNENAERRQYSGRLRFI